MSDEKREPIQVRTLEEVLRLGRARAEQQRLERRRNFTVAAARELLARTLRLDEYVDNFAAGYGLARQVSDLHEMLETALDVIEQQEE